MSKKILSAVVALVLVFAMFVPMTASAAVNTPVTDSANFDKVVGGWYTAKNGGFKFNVGSWIYFGQYGLTLVAENGAPVHACTVAVYEADSDAVFAAKTQADFETINGEAAIEFKKTTVGNNGFPMYYYKSATYENYVFQAHGQKYYVNFIYANGYANGGTREDFTKFASKVMKSIVLADDPKPANPNPPTGDNTAIIAVAAVAAVSFVALVATKKRARAK